MTKDTVQSTDDAIMINMQFILQPYGINEVFLATTKKRSWYVQTRFQKKLGH